MNKQHKRKKQIIASVLAFILLSSGTFAWQSFSQVATNEIIDNIDTPGARLHDYFNGVNKDVFVENYATGADAPDVYARIKLSEYFEYGKNAGTSEAENPTIVRGDIQIESQPEISDVKTWDVYTIGSTAIDGKESIRTYRELITGGEGIYLPTYNLNNESLEVEINGTFGGATGDGRENKELRYDDYVEFEYGKAYDQDKIETTEPEAHVAALTADANAISMNEWLELDDAEKIGDFWVFDITGWAYYAKPIPAKATSGLLLDEIAVVKNPQYEWYYAVEVTAQIATFGDWGEKPVEGVSDGTGMYGELTEDAQYLLSQISTVDNWIISDNSHLEDGGSQGESSYIIDSFEIKGLTQEQEVEGIVELAVGEELQLSVEVISSNNTKPDEIQGVDWSITPVSKTINTLDIESTFINGVFKPVEGMEYNTYILTAKSQYDITKTASVLVEVKEIDIYAILDLDTRYTYSVLDTDELKEVYRQLALGIYYMEESIYITVDGYDNSVMGDVLLAIVSDFPEFFWAYFQYYNYADRLVPVYAFTEAEVEEMKKEIDEAEEKYLKVISQDMTDYQKITTTYRYVCDNVEYLAENEHQSIYGAMVAEEAVCAGYARMFQYLIMRQGIECAYISGIGRTTDGDEAHGWNLVKLDGEYYYVDATWGDGYSRNDRYNYYYMVQTYENMVYTHKPESIYAIPVDAFGTKYEYITYNSILFETYDQEAVKNAWVNMYWEGLKQFDLQFTNSTAYSEAIAELYTNQKALPLMVEASGKSISTFGGSVDSGSKTITFFVTYSTAATYNLNAVTQNEGLVMSRFK